MSEIISYNDIEKMAITMAKSEMFGKNRDQMLSLMLIAQAEGLHPANAALEYDVIQGRPSLRGQAALARFQQSGGSVKWIKRDDTEARALFSHPKGGSLEISWTMERAVKMGLASKDNWRKQPSVMLTWRCVAEGVRAVYPACLNRVYLSEEVQDFEPAEQSANPTYRDITPSDNNQKKENSIPDNNNFENPKDSPVYAELIKDFSELIKSIDKDVVSSEDKAKVYHFMELDRKGELTIEKIKEFSAYLRKTYKGM